jgi:hypothetical protein
MVRSWISAHVIRARLEVKLLLAGFSRDRRADAALLLSLAVVAALLFGPGLLGHLLTVRDMPGITLPSRAFWRSAVMAGELPVWNPLVAIGIPTMAVPIHGTLYPGHLLLLVGSLGTGVALTWAVHLWIAGAGGYALARTVGCRPEAAFIAGSVLGIGGYAISMVWNGEKTLPHAWIPWMAWATYRAAASPTARRIAVAALPPALICAAGDPFLIFDAFILSIPFAVAAMPAGLRTADGVRRTALGLLAPLVLGVLLAAPVWVPAMALRSATARASFLPIDLAEAWSMHPVRWLELFVSRPLGDPLGPTSLYSGGAYADAPTVQALPWAVSLYVGAATFALATVARGRLAVGLVVAACFAVLLALGKHLPVHAWARVIAPPLALTRFPEKHVVVACDALALLAALGTDRLLRREADPRVSLGVAGLGLVVAFLLVPADLRGAFHSGAVQSAVVLVLVAAAFLVARRVPRLLVLPALVVCADLAFAARPLLAWSGSRGLPRSPLAEDVLRGATALPPRVLRFNPLEINDFSALPGNASSLFGFSSLPGIDSARTPELDPLVYALAGDGSRTWEVLRVGDLILPDLDAPDAASGADRWRVVKGPDRPRAWMVARADVMDGTVALGRIANSAFDVETEAIVSSDTAREELVPLLQGSKREIGSCDVVHYGSNRVDLACSAPVAALVVLADGFAAGWDVSIDGTPPVEPMRVDTVYRGVVVAAGAHRVRFSYSPPGLAVGALLAALGVLMALFAVVRSTAGPRPKLQ